MDDREMDIFSIIKGLKKVDPANLVEFQRAMEDRTIPDIVRNVEERKMLAAESRLTILK